MMKTHLSKAILFTLWYTIHSTRAYFNFYMDSEEAMRILGVPGELYYVKSGEINEYALSFSVPLKSSVREIFFTWSTASKDLKSSGINHSQNYPGDTVRYSLTIVHSNSGAMDQPRASIPSRGLIPANPAVFSVTLPCTGLVTGEVDVHIQLNISRSSHPSEVTTLDLRRKKTCHRGTADAVAPARSGSETHLEEASEIIHHTDYIRINTSSSSDSANQQVTLMSSGNLFYIGIGCSCAGILLLLLVFCTYLWRSKNKSGGDHVGDVSVIRPLTQMKFSRNDTMTNRSFMTGTSSIYQNIDGDHTYKQIGSVTKATLHQRHEDLTMVEVTNILKHYNISRELLLIKSLLMEGEFGRVYRGFMSTDSTHRQQQSVTIKTVSADVACKEEVESMLKEVCRYRAAGIHDNIACFTAATMQSGHPPLIIYSSKSEEKNLKVFFLQQQQNLQHNANGQQFAMQLSVHEMLWISLQIARGLSHLHHRGFIHTDVATRNCSIDGSLQVRLGDCALSRDIFPSDYSCYGNAEARPIKWMAVETLTERIHSQATDVWSYAVCVWEIFSHAQQPYSDIADHELLTYLLEGYRAVRPTLCSIDIFKLLVGCWNIYAEQRPQLSNILIYLEDLYKRSPNTV